MPSTRILDDHFATTLERLLYGDSTGVLGGGPGGYAAAFLAADLGMQVTLVEADPQLGGTCLLRGCIPSKALLHVARVISETHEMNDWGVALPAPTIDIDAMRARKEKVIATLSGGLKQLAKKRKVQVIQARATFEDSQTLRARRGRSGDLRGRPADVRALHSGQRLDPGHARRRSSCRPIA